MAKIALSILLLFFASPVFSQEDFTWWNEKHNWDGHTPWNQYLTLSTAFMGPNALPVPEVSRGRIDSSLSIEAAAGYHFGGGDKTKDIFTRACLPLYNNRMSVSVEVIPYEWFETDTITRDRRAARTRSGKGGAGGDIYLSAEFGLVKNHRSLPDLAFRAVLRMASGTNLGNARHTDGPGYFFDLSAGRNVFIKSALLRIYAMSGFYAYQTFDVQHLQNDCYLYGAGADLHVRNLLFSASIAGYSGYLDIGDKPLVYRASISLKGKKSDLKIGYQQGLNDYDFSRIRLGVIIHPLQKN